MAVVPAYTLAVGVGVASLWRWMGKAMWQRLVLTALLLGLGGWQSQRYLEGLGRGQIRNRPLPEFGLLMNELTTSDDQILVIGQEWDPILTYTIGRPIAFVRETHETDEYAWLTSRKAMAPSDFSILVAVDSVAGDLALVHHRCRELGLSTEPIFSTERADVYAASGRSESLSQILDRYRETGLILAVRPDRMDPGESRLEFITANWRSLAFGEANGMFDLISPYPDAVFTRHDPANLEADGTPVLHIHPPGGLRFDARSFSRDVFMTYGLRPEIWRNKHDSDGVRFRLLSRGPDGRQRLIWSDFVQPLTVAEDRALLEMNIGLPPNHDLELWIDAGPDHNPGYDWAIIGTLSVR